MKYCSHCRIGCLKETRVPYVHLLDDEPLIMPQMPALVCDVCGDIQYNDLMMVNLQYIIHHHEIGEKKFIRQAKNALSWRLSPQTAPKPI